MNEGKLFNSANKPTLEQKKQIVDFLFDHLGKYGDSKAAITKAINYAVKESLSFGGFVLTSYLDNEISGAVVVNQTGMNDYIPENILVYIATHINHRGKGIGKLLLQDTIKLAQGNIALHVEPENPARFLYEKVGFASKYLEMRLIK